MNSEKLCCGKKKTLKCIFYSVIPKYAPKCAPKCITLKENVK